jgi:hypothetical protein
MTVAVCCLLSVATVVFGAADRERAVEAGRDALDRSIWQYPWYDAKTDGVRPIRVAEPWRGWEWLADRVEAFFAWLGRLFTFRGGRLGSMTWLEWVAWAVILALLAVLAYLLVRAWRRRREDELHPAAAAGEPDPADERRRVEALPSAVKRGDLLGAAQECYQAGRYGEAIVYLFSHQLVQLDKNQLIRLAKGKTNRQYVRELGRRLPIRQLLEQTMVAFEDVFFGNHAIDRGRFETVWSRVDEFEALVAGE